MRCTCVVGLQWGDEAKGKIVDLLTEQHDFVVRYNGGANAGHTVVSGDQKFKLSLLPTGVLRPQVISVIGNGVVVDPVQFLKEVTGLRKAGVAVRADRLLVSNHAHVIFEYHADEEILREKGARQAIGTTGRGIGPCYQDKVARTHGVRVGELLDEGRLRERLREILAWKTRLIHALGDPAKTYDVEKVLGNIRESVEALKPHVADTMHVLHRGLREGKKILFEAAQGTLLDVDHGTYPFVTSSNSSTAGVWSGSGVPARYLSRVVGVIKAYSTRVGAGPFPTELDDGPQGIGERIRKTGKEYGTVTGRPRRCGWFDAVAARYSAALNGTDELALMLLDVLSEFDEVCIATSYELDGERIDEFPSDSHLLQRCRPVYETLPGWRQEISGLRRLQDLPANARRYIDRLAELLRLPVSIISVGPDRVQTLLVTSH
jgi:adenylosuccinate synthase